MGAFLLVATFIWVIPLFLLSNKTTGREKLAWISL